MSADLLREAAAKMREDARVEAILREGDPHFSGEASAYERAWHPAVALAVADGWLEATAKQYESPRGADVTALANAMAFARTYLGRDA